MHIQILTIFPELFAPFARTSLIGRAIDRELLRLDVRDLRDFTEDRHRSVDDEPYGGGGGMVMTAPPWLAAVRSISAESGGQSSASTPRRILLSPQGRRLDEALAVELASSPQLMLLCGRYEGIDERVRKLVVDDEISIGDYVLSGGELPAMVLIEAVSRKIPGVVGLADSVANDSFRAGLLDFPHYTRPPEVEGERVPDVLLSGDHARIVAWRRKEALQATLEKRPDLLSHAPLDDHDRRVLATLTADRRAERSGDVPRVVRRPEPGLQPER